jgi:hypothetical protein
VGAECTLAVATPYRVCIRSTSFRSCPVGSVFAQSFLFETGVSAPSCESCPCTVTATCPGTIELFSDVQCTDNELDIAADGTCKPSPSTALFGSFRYVLEGGPVDEVCDQWPSAADVQKVNEQEVCCVP